MSQVTTHNLGINFTLALSHALKIVKVNGTRAYSTVILVSKRNDHIVVVAADSFILYEHKTLCAPADTSPDFSVCIKVADARNILKNLGLKNTKPVYLSLNIEAPFNTCLGVHLNNGVHVSGGTFFTPSQVKYPNYLPVIPDFSRGHRVDRLLPMPKGPVSKEGIDISTIVPSLSPATVNPRYLKLACSLITGKNKIVEVHQHLTEAENPLTFRTMGGLGSTITVVIVPFTNPNGA